MSITQHNKFRYSISNPAIELHILLTWYSMDLHYWRQCVEEKFFLGHVHFESMPPSIHCSMMKTFDESFHNHCEIKLRNLRGDQESGGNGNSNRSGGGGAVTRR